MFQAPAKLDSDFTTDAPTLYMAYMFVDMSVLECSCYLAPFSIATFSFK